LRLIIQTQELTDVSKDHPAFALLPYAKLIKPYDELLADLAVSLHWDDPRIISKSRFWLNASEDGFILTLHDRNRLRGRSFDISDPRENSLPTEHDVLAASRNLVWNIYLRLRSEGVSKAEFFNHMMNVVRIILDHRFKTEDFRDG